MLDDDVHLRGGRAELRLGLLGALPDSGNLGVSALYLSTLAGIAQRAATAEITVFDDEPGLRTARALVGGAAIDHSRCGAIPTRRVYRPDSLWQIRVAGRIGGRANRVIRIIRDADAVLDVTGGDSFTDLYGPRRFAQATIPKLIVLEQDRPLIFLPQTIGPFLRRRSRKIAERILAGASMVWARDRASYSVLREMLGDAFDPQKHRCGVDLAFGLPAQRPASPLPAEIQAFLDARPTRPLIGFNVSGLLLQDEEEARRRFGLRAGYREAALRFLARVIQQTDANILLVPHVQTLPGQPEDDLSACASVADGLRDRAGDRLAVLDAGHDPCETKWIIGQTDWFCGTRLHSAIAALSSGVPAAAIAYSGKTRGVFATCRQERHVADPRALDTEGIVRELWQSWTERSRARFVLERAVPHVLRKAEFQMDEIIAHCAAPDAAPVSSVSAAAAVAEELQRAA